MFRNLSIRIKLLIAFLLMSSAAVITVWIIASRTSTTALLELAFSQLESLREVKKTHIERFFVERERNMGDLVGTVSLFEQAAFEKMWSVQQEKKAQVEIYAQQWHDDITILASTGSLQNMGNFEMLLDGQGGVKLATLDMYETQYLGDSLHHYVQKYQYADVLLITERGNIVYTVMRGPDLGQNVLTGPLRQTALAACFQEGMQGLALRDFTPYPTPDQPYAAFIAAPVVSQLLKKPIGVVVLKIDSRMLNTIVQRREGMGRTGETYLVGQSADGARLLSDQVVRNGKIGDVVADREVETLVSGGVSGALIRMGRDGTMEIMRADPLALSGLHWGLITTMHLEEALAPKQTEAADDYFTQFLHQYGYADLFLIHPDGTVFHSVAHRADYGANLHEEPYASTGLGQVFRKALESQAFSFSDFHPYAPLEGQPVGFMAQPVMHNNTLALVVAVQIPIDEVNSIMQERSGMGTTGETYLVGADQLMRSDSHNAPDRYSVLASFANSNTGAIDTFASREALAGKTERAMAENYMQQTVLSAYTPIEIGDIRWALIAEISVGEALASAHRFSAIMRTVAMIGCGVIVVFSFMVTGYLTRPIKRLVYLAQQVSEGDLSIEFQEKQFGRDEIGILARAFQNVVTYFREMADIATNVARGDLRQAVAPKSDRDLLGHALQQMTTYLQDIATEAAAFADGDLRQKIAPRSEFDVLGKALYKMTTLRQIIRHMIGSAQQLGNAADQLTQISGIMAIGAEETSCQTQTVSTSGQQMNQNINSVSTAAEEYAVSIQEISRTITEVAHLITVAVDATNTANATMVDLESRSVEIDEISKVITAITQQTNLLALNATIEAARAGEVGRGFAVVANEVKELAKETGRATDDITRLIEAIQASIAETREAITHVLEVVQQVHSLSASMTNAVEQQATTTKEISHNILEVARGSDEITLSMNEVANAANHASANAATVQAAASELSTLAEELRQVVGQFKI